MRPMTMIRDTEHNTAPVLKQGLKYSSFEGSCRSPRDCKQISRSRFSKSAHQTPAPRRILTCYF